MNFDDIFIFVKLIDIGTFTELAKHLNVSQSTVSRRIQNLEESVNMKLIKRNSRGLIEMTEDGESFYRSFKDIEKQANTTLQQIVNKSKEISGTLKVGIPKLFLDNILADKLGIFYARYPNVKLVFSYTAGIIDLVKDDIDIAITIKKPITSSCTIKTLVRAKNKLYASQDYIQTYGQPNLLQDLESHDVVGFLHNDKFQTTLIAFSEKDDSKKEVSINQNMFLNNFICDINIATKCNKIINTLDIFANSKLNVLPVLDDYYFGRTDFYLVRATGVRNNLEQEFVKFIDVCLQEY
ncbi:LysR family transcriptional regulator [Francisella noatunensis]|uniref:LysR family transcriptional regulator n=1 Tax=Francisella noatunensis TaxID=657445 RepID=A0A9Q2KXC6_9GAMM|nr:LysR family transcriptional regulator [Francisella noatunensis]MBK2029239.1 LysR family transcriptional regulator [Francisella noatunensis]MBK2034162.1 LysR family transcriptional regulator [Francisella noatunensis]MBK2049033.1 LysR family transcriptional regulator [Francisella noatunensis]MBK2050570.1 LysR family transcriptional regulator [Francisella noatunensis]MBK2051923.1 LysR family transcriptional regulator [Francisella noatunensis]